MNLCISCRRIHPLASCEQFRPLECWECESCDSSLSPVLTGGYVCSTCSHRFTDDEVESRLDSLAETWAEQHYRPR